MDGRRLLREMLPPICYRLLGTLNPAAVSLVGPYKSWEEARKKSGGYDAGNILDKVEAAGKQVMSGAAAFERDSVLFHETEYNFPLITVLLRAALENESKLSIVDFGGSLGSSYFQNRAFLAAVNSLQWNIVEQGEFVTRGKQHFESDELHFYHSLQECLQQGVPQVLLLCSVLQYLEQPYELLDEILEFDIPYLIIERTPFSTHSEDSIMVQKVPAKIYKASYPSWLFDYGKLLERLGKNYEMISTLDVAEQTVGIGRYATRYRTLLMRRRGGTQWPG